MDPTYLATQRLFSGVANHLLLELADTCTVRALKPGEIVFREGESGEDAFIIVSGAVRVMTAVAPGLDRTLAVLWPGALFGEAAIVDPQERSASTIAETDCELLSLPGADTRAWMLRHTDVGVVVMGRMATILLDRVRLTNEQVRDGVRRAEEIAASATFGLGEDQVGGRISVRLLSGVELPAVTLVRVERAPQGLQLWCRHDDGAVLFVPYHAIASIAFPEARRGSD